MKNDTKKSKFNSTYRFALFLLTVFFSVSTAQSAVFTVTNTNDDGAGSLRQAILDADFTAGDDTIDFNLSGCPCTITTSGLSIFGNFTPGTLIINGLGADQLSISGGGNNPVFLLNFADVTFNDITITGGNGEFFGGGIDMFLGTLVVNNSRISGNSSQDSGGGIRNGGGILTLTNSIVSNNSALNSGGGIVSNGVLNLINSTVSDNSAHTGGGIRNSGSLTVNNSTISGNPATIGGGLANFFTANVTNSTISGNSANIQGGGIENRGTLTLTNTTVSGNSAFGVGAIVNFATITLTDSTITENSSSFSLGIGGIANVGTSGTFTLSNSIVAGNSAPDFNSDAFGTFDSQGYNLIGVGDFSTGFGAAGDQVGTLDSPINPMLGPLADNGGPTKTHALLAGSPAIDAGNSQLPTDQRGFPRPVDVPLVVNAANGSDIGAVEVFYNFSGFFPPISSNGFNTATAGSAIPIKFSLGGNFGLDIFAEDSPSSQKISCSNSAPTGSVESITTAGGSNLSYDTLTDQYTLVWKTNKSFSGDCRRLTVSFNDGSSYSADFQFK